MSNLTDQYLNDDILEEDSNFENPSFNSNFFKKQNLSDLVELNNYLNFDTPNSSPNHNELIKSAKSLSQSNNMKTSNFLNDMVNKVDNEEQLNSGEQNFFNMVKKIADKEGIETHDLLQEVAFIAEDLEYDSKIEYLGDSPIHIMKAAQELANENEMDNSELFLDLKNKVDNGFKLNKAENDILEMVQSTSKIEGDTTSDLLEDFANVSKLNNNTFLFNNNDDLLDIEMPELLDKQKTKSSEKPFLSTKKQKNI